MCPVGSRLEERNELEADFKMSKLALMLGVAFIFLAGIYLFVPANSLPSFVPGYDPDLQKVHYKHGLAAFVVGASLLAYAWPSSHKK